MKWWATITPRRLRSTPRANVLGVRGRFCLSHPSHSSSWPNILFSHPTNLTAAQNRRITVFTACQSTLGAVQGGRPAWQRALAISSRGTPSYSNPLAPSYRAKYPTTWQDSRLSAVSKSMNHNNNKPGNRDSAWLCKPPDALGRVLLSPTTISPPLHHQTLVLPPVPLLLERPPSTP